MVIRARKVTSTGSRQCEPTVIPSPITVTQSNPHRVMTETPLLLSEYANTTCASYSKPCGHKVSHIRERASITFEWYHPIPRRELYEPPIFELQSGDSSSIPILPLHIMISSALIGSNVDSVYAKRSETENDEDNSSVNYKPTDSSESDIDSDSEDALASDSSSSSSDPLTSSNSSSSSSINSSA
jgi:hypothetical protein